MEKKRKKTKSFSKEASALFLTGTSFMQTKGKARTVKMISYLKRKKS